MGDLLNGVPHSSKETWIIVFLPLHAYKFFTISLPFKWVCGSEWVSVFVKNDVKWVCGSDGFVIFDENDLPFLATCHF